MPLSFFHSTAMKRILLPILLLFPAVALGQAQDSLTIYSGTTVATTATGSMVCLSDDQWPNSDSFILVQNVTTNAGTLPTFDGEIQYTTDGGTTWFVLDTFSQVISGTTAESVHINEDTTSMPRCFRGKRTIGGTSPSFTFTQKILFKSRTR